MNRTDATEMMKSAKRAVLTTCARTGFRASESDVQDICSAAYVKVLESFQADKGDIGGYTYRIACNEAVDFLRNTGHRRIGADTVSLVTEDSEGGETELDLVSCFPTPYQALVASRRDAAVTVALASLTESERESLLGDDDQPDTSAIRVRRHRAIAKVQEDVVGQLAG